MRARIVFLFATLVLAMTFVPFATAGGWATAALVDDVGVVAVGEPFSIRYVVRAHGVEGQELAGMETSLEFTNSKATGIITSTGKVSGKAEIYEATVTLPVAGVWNWKVIIHNYLLDNDIESPMPTLTANVTGETPDASAGKTSGMTTVVTINDGAFSPATLEVEAGDTVTWVNEGTLVHQVAADASGFDTSPMIQPGEAFFQTLVEPGTFDYFCPPHPGMIGSVIVGKEGAVTGDSPLPLANG